MKFLNSFLSNFRQPKCSLPKKKFFPQHTLDVKGSIKYFFDNNNIDWRRLELHLIESEIINNTIIVTVTLGCPGILIGKAGSRINALTKHLSEYMNSPVEIKLKEFSVWDIYLE